MTSSTKWDRDAYIERADGPEEAERRRKVLLARQSGQRLADERKQRIPAQSPPPRPPDAANSPGERIRRTRNKPNDNAPGFPQTERDVPQTLIYV